jgi:hypothetical protein
MTSDGLTIYVSSTDANGVVDPDTRLRFRELGDRVIARYRGGNVERGVLVGRPAGAGLTFRYAQRERDGMIQSGQPWRASASSSTSSGARARALV